MACKMGAGILRRLEYVCFIVVFMLYYVYNVV